MTEEKIVTRRVLTDFVSRNIVLIVKASVNHLTFYIGVLALMRANIAQMSPNTDTACKHDVT